MLNKLQKKLKINDGKWVNKIENLGNTVSATIPIAINLIEKDFKFPKKFLLMGFGVGLSVAGCIIS